jgi:nucleotide-binding universal stress UspA family protein
MHKVLLPVDGADQSRRAIDFFATHMRFSGPVQAVLLAVHPASETRTLAMHRDVILADLRESADEVLAVPRQRLDAAGIPYKQRLELGDIAPTIVRVAREEGCGHIIMGTRGRGGFDKLLLGSVATEVLELTHVPVTLVK